MYFINRFYRAPDPEGTPGYQSMMDIEKPIEPIIGGDGKLVLPVLDPAKLVDPPTPEGKIKQADGTFIDDPNYKKPEPVIVPEGKKLDVDGKTLIDDPDFKPVVDPLEPEEDFWGEVEKHTGRKVEVKYPEGIEPASVEGAAVRELAVRETAINDWETGLQKKFPRAYAYMMHHIDGGSDEEFLGGSTGVSLPERTIVESTVDVQVQLLKQDLLNKGVDPEVVEVQVASDIKKNLVKDKALKIYDGIQTAQIAELAKITQRNLVEQTRVDNLIKGMSTALESTVATMGFVVPEAQKSEFIKYVEDNLRLDKSTDTFYIYQPLKKEDIKSHMEALFFQFAKGDLSKIVAKKVQTQAAQKLRINVEKTKKPLPNNPDTDNNNKNFVPLGSMGM